MNELQPNRWRRIKNPQPKMWPGPWVEWRKRDYSLTHYEGACSLANLYSYLGHDQANRISRAIVAGKRYGKIES